MKGFREVEKLSGLEGVGGSKRRGVEGLRGLGFRV